MPIPVFAEARTAPLASRPMISSISSLHPLRLRGGEVDLVDHRHDLMVVLDALVDVGQRLRFDALRRVDDQQRAFARGQAPADTSYAKSTWPGVSIRLSSYVSPSAAFHSSRTVWALIVIPRSFSMSILSRTCADISRSVSPPVRWISRSASVDFPMIDVRDDRKISDAVDFLPFRGRAIVAVQKGAIDEQDQRVGRGRLRRGAGCGGLWGNQAPAADRDLLGRCGDRERASAPG